MKYEIYIKGCYEKEKNAVSFAFAVIEDGDAFEKRLAKYVEQIKTRAAIIPILPNKGQFQAELCAVAWAMFYLPKDASDVVVYSNNQTIVGWLNKWDCPDDYVDLLSVCRSMSNGRIGRAEWISKSSDNEWNVLVNEVAADFIESDGLSVTKNF